MNPSADGNDEPKPVVFDFYNLGPARRAASMVVRGRSRVDRPGYGIVITTVLHGGKIDNPLIEGEVEPTFLHGSAFPAFPEK